MKVDVKFGGTWGDATHSWEELGEQAPVTPEPVAAPNPDSTPLWQDACMHRHEPAVAPPWEEARPAGDAPIDSGPPLVHAEISPARDAADPSPPADAEALEILEQYLAELAPLTSGRNNALYGAAADTGRRLVGPGWLGRAFVEERFDHFLHDVWELNPDTDKAWGTVERGLDKGIADYAASNGDGNGQNPSGAKPDGGNGQTRAESAESPFWQHITATYDYRDEAGTLLFQVCRIERPGKPKEFLQRRPNGQGGWIWKTKGVRRVLYRLPELIADIAAGREILIVEGEKDVDNLRKIGFTATCNPEGAGKWRAEYGEFLKGAAVVVVPDHDDQGRQHRDQVVASLQDKAAKIRVLELAAHWFACPAGGDVSDWLAAGGTAEKLREMLERAGTKAPDCGYTLVRASDIIPRALDWLWLGHLLCGSLELLTGVPGLAKSQLQCQFVACASTGRAWPDGHNGVPAGHTIMLTAEDSLDQILVPRLIAAGADLDRVHILKKIRKDNKDRMFLLGEDLEVLAKIIADLGDVRLVTLDPITAYMGKVDSHRATDVRGQLGPLAELADRTDVAFSAITHPAKNASQRAIDNFIGSQAYIAAARIGHMCVEEMQENASGARVSSGRNLFTNPKNNPHPKMQSQAYRIGTASGGKDQRTGQDIEAPVIIWEELVNITADEALAAANPGKERGPRSVVNFLLDILANGPVLKKIIEDRAAAHGFSEDQLQRAKGRMGIVSFKEKLMQGRWYWALPQHAPRDDD
jgi:putative DNA primase/helicase